MRAETSARKERAMGTILPPASVVTDMLDMWGLKIEPAPRAPDTSRIPAILNLVAETTFTDAVATARPARRAS